MIRSAIVGSFGSRRRGWLAAAALVCACDARSLAPPGTAPDPGHGVIGPQGVNRNIDILFLVDDSASMSPSQANLIANFPALMAPLENSPAGLPDVHIAVISSDMGAGDGSIAGCDATGGKRGVFQYTPRGNCTATGLQPGATFISNVGGQPNYSGTLADTFSCIAALGDGGCGFERPFASILRALGADGQPAPSENQAFLRPEAFLMIVLITNEDDCSATAADFYDTTNNTDMGSRLGPPANFRCNEFGHVCTIGGNAYAHPDRNAPGNDANATVTYDNCQSNDSEAILLSARQTADRLKALKPDPSMLMVAAITGAPAPYTLQWMNPPFEDSSCGAASCPWPSITRSCTATDGSYADPAVRINELVGEFGANGLWHSICDSSFAPALMRLGEQLNAQIGHP